MGVHIVTHGEHVRTIVEGFQRAAAHWAGGDVSSWRTLSGARGVAFAREGGVYLFTEMDGEGAIIGGARRGDDAAIFAARFAFDAPDADHPHIALAWDDDNADGFLLISADAPALRGVDDPFRRLAGTAAIRRAEYGARDYVMIGPLDKPRGVDGVFAFCKLSPDAAPPRAPALYDVAPEITRTPRARERALTHMVERLSAQGGALVDAARGPLKPDAALRMGETVLHIAALTRASADDLARAIGVLAACATDDGAAMLLAPAPVADEGGALEALRPAFARLGVSLTFYALTEEGVRYRIAIADPRLSALARASLGGEAQTGL